jgi:hypothetical protein
LSDSLDCCKGYTRRCAAKPYPALRLLLSPGSGSGVSPGLGGCKPLNWMTP